MPDDAGSSRAFQTTNWQEVRRAGDADPAVRREALGRLLQLYGPALQTHLVHRYGLEVHAAEDLLQDFIREKVLEDGVLAAADPRQGKFRTYLLTLLRNYALSDLRKSAAKKRTALRPVSLEEESPAVEPQADAFDAAWALRVLSESIRLMQERCTAEGRDDLWAVFAGRTLALVDGAAPVPYEKLASPFGFSSNVQAANALTTARRKFGSILRTVIGAYAEEDEVDGEIEDLKRALVGAGAELLEKLRTSLWEATPGMSASAFEPRQPALDLLARLMQLGIRGRRALQADEMAALLQSQLMAPLRFELGVLDADLLQGTGDAASGAGVRLDTFADLLHHPNPPVELLTLTKQFARDQRQEADGPVPPEVATVLYYAAIVAALVRHHERITHLDDVALCYGAQWAIDQPWVDGQTRTLFEEGLQRLQPSGEGGIL